MSLALKWKRRLDDLQECGGAITELEREMFEDIQNLERFPTSRLEIIEERDEGDGAGRQDFRKKVSDFISSHHVKVVKFQRNLFFDVTGSDPMEPKTRELKQEYVAFIVWEAV